MLENGCIDQKVSSHNLPLRMLSAAKLPSYMSFIMLLSPLSAKINQKLLRKTSTNENYQVSDLESNQLPLTKLVKQM